MSDPPAENPNSTPVRGDGEEFQLAQRAEADAEPELVLAPPEGKSKAEIQAELDAENRPRLSDYRELPLEPVISLKFTLADLFLVVTCCAMGFAGASWTRPDVYAGLLGCMALVTIPVFYLFGAEAPWIRRMWIVILTVYLTACVAAIVRVAFAPGP